MRSLTEGYIDRLVCSQDMTRALQNFKSKGKGASYSDMPKVLAKL